MAGATITGDRLFAALLKRPHVTFAQSFDPEAGTGTGNVLPSYFESDGTSRAGNAGPQAYKTASRHHHPRAHTTAI